MFMSHQEVRQHVSESFASCCLNIDFMCVLHCSNGAVYSVCLSL